ncbi:MAG TPA: L,D-transpeptidase, partial [Ktedonobacteraceae bacterium]|nr:L,D-transpeptidase [Ktedonobacteraceae bacterium]
MQKITRKRDSAWLPAWVLAIVLLLSPCVFWGHASLSTAQAATHARSLRQPVVGKIIVVSLSHQWLYAYLNGSEVFNTAVMTGR